MGMFSEIADEMSVGVYVGKIKQELEKNKGNSQACKVLKEIGRFALTQFGFDTPDWAHEYEELFRDTPDKVLFYEGPWYCFSNFASFMVHWQGRDWMTSEHAYQAAKFINLGTIWEIKDARSAHNAKKIARANNIFKVPNWQDIKLSVMKSIVRAKLGQHPYIQKKLLETGGMEIIEDSPTDAFWGRGPDGNGLNHMGKIWMLLRTELRFRAG